MTRDEAFQAMCDGKNVSHYNFSQGEFLFLYGNVIKTEDGYRFCDKFWNTDWMEDGWSICQ